MQSNESGYDSAAESVSSSEAIRAVNSLVRADLHEARDALRGPPLLLCRDPEAHWNNASYAPEKEFTEGGRCNGGCSPCLFHNARLGCPRGDACRYCHEHDIGAERVPHRPRKTLRHKIKRNAEDLLRRFDVSPERVHDELQVLAAGSQFAVNFLAGPLPWAIPGLRPFLRKPFPPDPLNPATSLLQAPRTQSSEKLKKAACSVGPDPGSGNEVDPRTFGTSPMVDCGPLSNQVPAQAADPNLRNLHPLTTILPRAVVAELSDSEPCLVLVSLEGLLPDAASPDWAMIAWTPADAPVKLRMLCASSRRTLREEFADFSFREYNATERSEVTLAQYVESTRDRTEDDRHAAMTRDEIDQEEVRKQVAKEQASAPKLLAGLAALQVRTQPSFEDSMKRFLEKTEGSAVITKLAGALVRDGNVGLKPSNVYTAIQDSEELGAELIEAVLRGHGWRRQEVINRLRGGPGKYRVQPARSGREAEDEDLYLQGRSFFGFRSASLLPQRISVMEKYGIFAQASVVENVRSFAGDMEEAGDDDDLEDDLGAPRAIVSEEASPVPKATGPRPPAGGIALPGFGPPSPLKPTSPSRGEGGGYAQTSPLCLNSDSLRFKEKEKMDEKSVFDAKPQVQSMVVQSLHKHNITERAQRLQYRRFPLHGLQELQDSSFWKAQGLCICSHCFWPQASGAFCAGI
ncbi:Twf2 [Symbiodinium microadriaticum]|nr:Twf2 [Symbiodinium microadriaticum]